MSCCTWKDECMAIFSNVLKEYRNELLVFRMYSVPLFSGIIYTQDQCGFSYSFMYVACTITEQIKFNRNISIKFVPRVLNQRTIDNRTSHALADLIWCLQTARNVRLSNTETAFNLPCHKYSRAGPASQLSHTAA